MIASWASVATLILFSLYILGRIITIFTVRKIWLDEVVFNQDDFDKYGVVEEIGDFEYNDKAAGLLVSKMGMRNIRFYTVENDSDGIPSIKGREFFSKEFLNVNQAIAIYVQTGDLFPTLYIDYETIDYMRVNLEWCDNLKSGVFSEFVVPHHTIKSFFYYMCR